MIVAIDVYYVNDTAKAVGVFFEWEDECPKEIFIETLHGVEEYVPGEFYKRELPSIENLLKTIDLNAIEAIVIDGYVYVDDDKKFGLGGYVWNLLNQTIPVIGVAKTSFFKSKFTILECYRGESKKPLYISAIGMSNQEALLLINKMHGEYRIPSILKTLDQITKS